MLPRWHLESGQGPGKGLEEGLDREDVCTSLGVFFPCCSHAQEVKNTTSSDVFIVIGSSCLCDDCCPCQLVISASCQ